MTFRTGPSIKVHFVNSQTEEGRPCFPWPASDKNHTNCNEVCGLANCVQLNLKELVAKIVINSVVKSIRETKEDFAEENVFEHLPLND